ncbi:uncharacterized protein METZ01_LOCUS214758, partial [marine metagenome]
ASFSPPCRRPVGSSHRSPVSTSSTSTASWTVRPDRP